MSTEAAKAYRGLAAKPRAISRVDPALYPWLLVAVGLLAAYVPSFIGVAQDIWSTGDAAQGPLILGAFFWVMYREWPLLHGEPPARAGLVGWPLLILGLLVYIVGRSQDFTPFEIGSLLLVLPAIVLLLRGVPGLKRVWFPLLLLCFVVPIPGQIITAVTLPLAVAVSKTVDALLFALGYPIAREGVVLQLGPYQLLVANACAGLHTFFALEALGLLYINLVKHPAWVRNLGLILLIVPIAFVANIIRVTTLALITYHFGDDAGQGFLHGFAGMVLFLSALALVMLADSILRRFGTRRAAQPA